MNAVMKRKLNSLDMDYLRRSEYPDGKNNMIRERTSAQNCTTSAQIILERIEIRGQMIRSPNENEAKLSHKLFNGLTSPRKKKRGKLQRSWNKGIRQILESHGRRCYR